MDKAALVLARLNSTRFPNKALYSIGNRSLIEWCIFNLQKENNYEIILTTSVEKSDDPLIEIADQMGIKHFRGDLNNVYLRVMDCLHSFGIQSFARVNGDSPFPGSWLINQGFDLLKAKKLDFVSNLTPRSFPYGVAVEVFDSNTFINAYGNLVKDSHYEHITSYFYENLELFKHANINSDLKNANEVRLVVDTPEDVDQIEQIIQSIDIHKKLNYKEILKIVI